MKNNKLTNKSKIIAEILRHNPYKYNLEISVQGWVSVGKILENVTRIKNMNILEEIVYQDGKTRYEFNEDKTLIRANQGHSLNFIDVGLKEFKLTKCLYHGTTPAVVDIILNEGLKPMTRQYVHLSLNEETAYTVGKRYSKEEEPVILKISENANVDFFVSKNKVVLTKHVPAQFISLK